MASPSLFLSLVSLTVFIGLMISETLLKLYVTAVKGFAKHVLRNTGSRRVLWVHTYRTPLDFWCEFLGVFPLNWMSNPLNMPRARASL